jgi:hypothetical protein
LVRYHCWFLNDWRRTRSVRPSFGRPDAVTERAVPGLERKTSCAPTVLPMDNWYLATFVPAVQLKVTEVPVSLVPGAGLCICAIEVLMSAAAVRARRAELKTVTTANALNFIGPVPPRSWSADRPLMKGRRMAANRKLRCEWRVYQKSERARGPVARGPLR